MGKPRLEFKLISYRTNHGRYRKRYGSTSTTRIGFRQLLLTPIQRFGRILVLTNITNPSTSVPIASYPAVSKQKYVWNLLCFQLTHSVKKTQAQSGIEGL